VIAAYGASKEDLDHCMLHLAVLWLGWSSSWKPPKKNRHDWFTEAKALATKLGVWA